MRVGVSAHIFNKLPKCVWKGACSLSTRNQEVGQQILNFDEQRFDMSWDRPLDLRIDLCKKCSFELSPLACLIMLSQTCTEQRLALCAKTCVKALLNFKVYQRSVS